MAERPAQADPYIAHRLAAAILLGTVTSDRSEALQYAMELADETQPPRIAEATKQIVADVRRYDEGTAGDLEAELHAAAGRAREPDLDVLTEVVFCALPARVRPTRTPPWNRDQARVIAEAVAAFLASGDEQNDVV